MDRLLFLPFLRVIFPQGGRTRLLHRLVVQVLRAKLKDDGQVMACIRRRCSRDSS